MKKKYTTRATPTPYGLAISDSCVTCNLRTERFFCSLPVAALREFEKLRASTLLPKNSVLFVEGEMPRGIYIVCQGRVKLSTKSQDGRAVILKLAEAGEILGLSACVSGQAYALTAETHTPCQTSFVKRQDFLRFLRRNGAACLKAATHVSQRRNDAVDALRDLAHHHVANEKFAKFLLGHDAQGTNRLTLTMTHEEIAEVLGIARETVTRAFADFKCADWIAVQGRTVSIRNREALQKQLAT